MREPSHINSFTAGGYVESDPVYTASSSGIYLARFTLVSSIRILNSVKDDGAPEYISKPVFVKCVAMENKARYMEKAGVHAGTRLIATGSIDTEIVVDKHNRKTTVTLLVVDDLDLERGSKKPQWRSPLWKNHV